MDLTRMSDLAVLLALFYVGWRQFAYGCEAWRALYVNERLSFIAAGLLIWGLAALHAICHLGGSR
mgnify:CR=1 FL=1